MADTSQAEPAQNLPQTNGFADDGLDEEERGKMRPADIDADVREMERRKRVEMIMNSRLFREELERIFDTQMKEGGAGPGGLLQQLSDMMGHGGPKGNVFRSSSCVIPINDIRGLEAMGYSKGEKVLRCKLAAVYRLMDLYGWTQGIHNHITARLNQDEEHFLVNPWGMLYHEITASSLVKVDMQGNIVEKGTTNYGVNKDSFHLHSAIHAARPDIKCIIHIHTNSVLAVSSLKCGLLPLCQESCVIGDVSNHQYQGGLFEPEERDKISRNLGPNNKVMFLTNHGAMCCGETVEEAFFNVYNTVQACESQIKLLPMGIENLVLLTDETRKRVYEAARRPPEGFALDKSDKEKDKEVTSPTIAAKGKRWGVGCTEFEALMRMLDNAGFRTGYIYRHPLIKGDPPRPRNDVEVPPAVSSLGYLLEEEEMYRQGGWIKRMEGRKAHDRTRWLNSPNVYQKVEILETGTPDPKKITKWVDANADEWVADGSPTHSSTPVKIDTLQFVPKNTNPKEFKRLQQQIKENRRADKITSGPQSHILEGVSWEEAKKMQDANISQTGDQVILVGAASKGIIQRGFQHNAMVYKAPYAKNPFDTVTDDELEEYKKTVQRKTRGDGYDEDQSESEALSLSVAGRPPTGKSPTSPTSDDESRDDSYYPDAHVERSKSARFPHKATPDVVIAPGGFGRSWSLGRNKRKSRDCNGEKVANDCISVSLAKPLAAPPCPPHLQHAVYTSLPYCKFPKTVLITPPRTISCYSEVHKNSSGPQDISAVVSIVNLPEQQTLSLERLETHDDSDGDSLADVSSLPSSDLANLDENHNDMHNPLGLKMDHENVELQGSETKSTCDEASEITEGDDLDLEPEFSSPFHSCDTTVIHLKHDSGADSADNLDEIAPSGIIESHRMFPQQNVFKLKDPSANTGGVQPENHIDGVDTSLIPLLHKSVECRNLVKNCDDINNELLTACDEYFTNQDSSNHDKIASESYPHPPSLDTVLPCVFSSPSSAMVLKCCKVSHIDSSTTESATFTEMESIFIEDMDPVTKSPPCKEVESNIEDSFGSGLFSIVQNDSFERDSNDHCDFNSDEKQPHEEMLSAVNEEIYLSNDNDIIEISDSGPKISSCSREGLTISQSHCVVPQIESLSGESMIRIRDNERVDVYSFLDFSPTEGNVTQRLVVENNLVTRKEVVDMPASYNSHDISRGNLEIVDILHNSSFDLSGKEANQSPNCFLEESIPNGAGEILFDPSETCSEEFTPLSYVDFTQDCGEDYYSTSLQVQSDEFEPEQHYLSPEVMNESFIEIDCRPFSQNFSSTNPVFLENVSVKYPENTSTLSKEINHPGSSSSLASLSPCNGEERWPSFISYLSTTFDCGASRASSEETICSKVTLKNSIIKRRESFTKFSSSVSDIQEAAKCQSSPLELGRLFTLKKIRSFSESRLNFSS